MGGEFGKRAEQLLDSLLPDVGDQTILNRCPERFRPRQRRLTCRGDRDIAGTAILARRERDQPIADKRFHGA